MTMRSLSPELAERRAHSTGRRGSAHAYRRGIAPRVRPTPTRPPPARTALSLLGALADALADEGVLIRGALARNATPRAPVPTSVAVELVSEVPFVARFEIPLTTNDGVPFPVAVLVPLLRDLYERMGGATVTNALGVWRDDAGAFCIDASLTVEVWTSDREGLVAFLGRVRRDLDQDAIALRITRPEFMWIERKEGAS